ncbi:prevent-host-death family protein [Clostridium sp. CAG:411]|jgi:PHD/YefM family antitoxin component YafN of YafNO toxin-antitoxin module|nr:type II toxin-antitoxin system Phd/YefM family antitoxin [Lachnospiraceae bacterium]CDE44389.1 prevent-host-death family protein [Clostridium sp. CAG:411]
MPQIIPIKDLKNTSEISEMCHKTEEPIYVTKNGYGDMVIMSMEVYELTMKQLTMYRDIEISEEQMATGQVKDARAALKETRKKYGL